MAPKLHFLILILFFSSSLSHADPKKPIPTGLACDSTPHPSFCKSIFHQHPSGNLFDYGRFSLTRSLFDTGTSSGKIKKSLSLRSTLPVPLVRALEDCLSLSELNEDYLKSTGSTLNATDTLPDPESDKIQTALSALITNTETCLDGLQILPEFPGSVKNSLLAPLLDNNKIYSVSLSLFSNAWLPGRKRQKQVGNHFVKERVPRVKKPKKNKHRNLLFHEVEIGPDESLPLRMSDSNQARFESRSGRKLLDSGAVIVSDVVVVAKDGSGDFTTITDAVNSAPTRSVASAGYYLIYVTEGVYQEYVQVPKHTNYVMMIGDGINKTVITGNRNVVDGWTTYNSGTLTVVGTGFVGVNITVRNTAGPEKHQAVALRSSSDFSTFYTCSFDAYQDTLYTHSLRQFYTKCDIYGTVDFIFGNAAVVLQSCNIHPRLPMSNQKNMITAQGRTDINQNTGTSIQDCRIVPTPDLALGGGSTKTYLGRPWKLYSRTVFMQSYMHGFIEPAGWFPWDGNYALDTLYYAEHGNSGPGSGTSNRVTWPGYHVIDRTVAVNFTVANFLVGDDWLPATGVPYFSGLL